MACHDRQAIALSAIAFLTVNPATANLSGEGDERNTYWTIGQYRSVWRRRSFICLGSSRYDSVVHRRLITVARLCPQ